MFQVLSLALKIDRKKKILPLELCFCLKMKKKKCICEYLLIPIGKRHHNV